MFRFCGKRWRFSWVDRTALPKGRRGECDAPNVKAKEIRVRNDLQELVELETLLHEGLHACDWYKDEEWVHVAARNLAQFLYAHGWRRRRG